MSIIDTDNIGHKRDNAEFMVVSTEELTLSVNKLLPSILTSLEIEANTGQFRIRNEFGAIENNSNISFAAMCGLASYVFTNINNSQVDIKFYSQISYDQGDTWHINEHSFRDKIIKGTSRLYDSTSSEVFNFTPGSLLRFGFWSTSNDVKMIKAVEDVGGELIETPSFRWRLREV